MLISLALSLHLKARMTDMVERPRRRKRRRTSPDFRNAVAITGGLWMLCVVVLVVLKLALR
jgi:hypothetical protein